MSRGKWAEITESLPNLDNDPNEAIYIVWIAHENTGYPLPVISDVNSIYGVGPEGGEASRRQWNWRGDKYEGQHLADFGTPTHFVVVSD